MEQRDVDLSKLRVMRDDLRSMRTRLCDLKDNTNPTYHAFSQAVTSVSKVIAAIEAGEAG